MSLCKASIAFCSALLLYACGQPDAQLRQSEEVMRNLLAVDSWVNRYRMSRTPLAGAGYPRLADLKNYLLSKKLTSSTDISPLINPVTRKHEWPIETPRQIREYRLLVQDKEYFIGKGVVEFSPFVEGGLTSGYLIRAGDPRTGKVLCTNGEPFVKSSP
jgi:hypothetical protein